MLNADRHSSPIRRIWVQKTSTSSTSLQAKSSWFTAWSFRPLSESRLIFVIVVELSREMVWSSFVTTMEVLAIIGVRQWHFLECAQTIQSLFFSIHESMSEMFSFCLIWCVLGDIYNSNSTFLESFYHFSYVAVLWHMYSFILANYCIYHLATMKQWWNNSKQIYV